MNKASMGGIQKLFLKHESARTCHDIEMFKETKHLFQNRTVKDIISQIELIKN